MGLEPQQEKTPCPEFLFYIESDKNGTFAEKTDHKFNDIRHPKWPKWSSFMAKYFCRKTSRINMGNLLWSKFTMDDVIERFPWVPPSTSNAQQNFGPCRTPPKFNEVKISSKTKNNIVYLTFNMKNVMYDTIEWIYEWVYKTMFFRSFEALVKTVKTFRHVCSIISIIISSITMIFDNATLKNIS